jgi:hypothetical protein
MDLMYYVRAVIKKRQLSREGIMADKSYIGDFIGKTIKEMKYIPDLDPGMGREDHLHIYFTDGTAIDIFDEVGCSEHRFMVIDDPLYLLNDETLTEIVVTEPTHLPNEHGNGDSYDVNFLIIKTNWGSVSVVNHNISNGYYGTINVQIVPLEAEGTINDE